MLSFHNDSAIKEKYMARLRAHAAADEIVKGQYWENGKGCAVGCTIHSSCHRSYEGELGIPEWLARLEDALFEGLPNITAKSFPLRFLESIPVGRDLEPIKSKFLLFVLEESASLVKGLKISESLRVQVLEAIEKCSALHREGQYGRAAEAARAAEDAARAAAWAARAADAAARAADAAARAADAAAWASGAAAWASRAAAWASRAAAGAAARAAARAAEKENAYVKYANKLIELLQSA